MQTTDTKREKHTLLKSEWLVQRIAKVLLFSELRTALLNESYEYNQTNVFFVFFKVNSANNRIGL